MLKFETFLLSFFIYVILTPSSSALANAEPVADADPMDVQIDVEQLVSGGASGSSKRAVGVTIETMLQELLTTVNRIYGTVSNYEEELQSLKGTVEEMKTSLSNANSKLENLGCPDGFFQLSSSGQCFKYFGDTLMEWNDANSSCAAEGLVLAKPNDPLALRSYIVMRYGPSETSWIGALASSNGVVWDRDGQALQPNEYHPMLPFGPPPSRRSGYCMSFETLEIRMDDDDGDLRPYKMKECTEPKYILCELLRE